jgi:hypothetical protein
VRIAAHDLVNHATARGARGRFRLCENVITRRESHHLSFPRARGQVSSDLWAPGEYWATAPVENYATGRGGRSRQIGLTLARSVSGREEEGVLSV